MNEKLLLDFCHFVGNNGYKIDSWDDSMLMTIIDNFLSATKRSMIELEEKEKEIDDYKAESLKWAIEAKNNSIKIQERDKEIERLTVNCNLLSDAKEVWEEKCIELTTERDAYKEALEKIRMACVLSTKENYHILMATIDNILPTVLQKFNNNEPRTT